MVSKSKILAPLVVVFLLVSVLFFAFHSKLESWGVDWKLVLLGNGVLFLISVFSSFMHKRAMTTASTHAFLRFVYMAFIGKFLLVLAFVAVYLVSTGGSQNQYAIFSCLALYLVYSFIEISTLLKLNKRKNA